MRDNLLVVDGAISVVLAALVLALAPGLAVSALIAIGALLGCAATFGLRARRRRAGRSPSPRGSQPKRRRGQRR